MFFLCFYFLCCSFEKFNFFVLDIIMCFVLDLCFFINFVYVSEIFRCGNWKCILVEIMVVVFCVCGFEVLDVFLFLFNLVCLGL